MTRLPLALGLAAAAGLATSAAAQPTLSFESAVNGAGQNVFTFSLNSASTGSYAIELAFMGDILQQRAFGAVDVDTSGDAATFDGNAAANYAQDEDTWYDGENFVAANPGNNPFTGGVTSGYSEEAGGIFMALGSGPGATSSPYRVVQIVANGDVDWSGVVAQDGVDNQVGGTTVPEPGSLALLGLGGLAMLRRRR